MSRGRPRKITPPAIQGEDLPAEAPVQATRPAGKTARVRVKRDGVWLKDGERSNTGHEDTIDADAAQALKEAGFVDIL